MIVLMGEQISSKSKVVRVTVDSGICGFHCVIEAWEKEKRQISDKDFRVGM